MKIAAREAGIEAKAYGHLQPEPASYAEGQRARSASLGEGRLLEVTSQWNMNNSIRSNNVEEVGGVIRVRETKINLKGGGRDLKKVCCGARSGETREVSCGGARLPVEQRVGVSDEAADYSRTWWRTMGEV